MAVNTHLGAVPGLSAVRIWQIGFSAEPLASCPELVTVTASRGRLGDAMAGKRVFISYRHVPQDQRLAELLHDRFTAAGHSVFIDRRLKVGTDWVAEIDARITWCEVMVVLLSEDAAKSEMVQQEVLNARNLRKTLLPVRINYTGMLDYRLAAKLDRIQYLLWRNEEDDEVTVANLLDVLGGGELPAPPAPEDDEAKPPALEERPVSSADPRVLQQPGLQLDDPCYMARYTDALVMARAENAAGLTVINAPRQMGKTSLVLRYLTASEAKGKRQGYSDVTSSVSKAPKSI